MIINSNINLPHMPLSTLEGKRRIFTLILLIRSLNGVWVEELVRRGFSRPHARAMLQLLEAQGLATATTEREPDAQGIRIVFRLSERGLEFADLLEKLDALLPKKKPVKEALEE